MSEQYIVTLITVAGTIIGAIIWGYIQRGSTPIGKSWGIVLSGFIGLTIGLFGGWFLTRTPSSVENTSGGITTASKSLFGN